jgi:HEAT repeat protein
MHSFTTRAGILFGIAGVLGLVGLTRGCGGGEEGRVKFETPEAVMARLTDADDAVAWQAAIDLGRMRATVALSALSTCLRTDERPKLRAAAARSLSQIDTWDAIPALLEGMNDESDLVRKSADAAIIEMIGVDWQFDPDWDKQDREEWLAEFADHIDKERGGWESWQKRRDSPYEVGPGSK